MSPTDLERALVAIRDEIAALRAGGRRGKLLISNIVSDLANIPTKYSEAIAAVGDLGAGADDFERAQIARFAAYAAEYGTLLTAAQSAQASLSSVTEF
ncbi:MAG: hypothetical protein WC324_02115 [Candidatus Omnitrophota bacterium]|jgi:hypothetical protein